MTIPLRIYKPTLAPFWLMLFIFPPVMILAETQVAFFGSVLALTFMGVALGTSASHALHYPASSFVPQFALSIVLTGYGILLATSLFACALVYSVPHFSLAEWGWMMVGGFSGFLMGLGQKAALPLVLGAIAVTFFGPRMTFLDEIAATFVVLAAMPLLAYWTITASNPRLQTPPTQRSPTQSTHAIGQAIRPTLHSKVIRGLAIALPTPLLLGLLQMTSGLTHPVLYTVCCASTAIGITIVSATMLRGHADAAKHLWLLGIGDSPSALYAQYYQSILHWIIVIVGVNGCVAMTFAQDYPLLDTLTSICAFGSLACLFMIYTLHRPISQSASATTLVIGGLMASAVLGVLFFGSIEWVWFGLSLTSFLTCGTLYTITQRNRRSHVD